MNFDLTEEQLAVQRLARDFADREIAPGARERDRSEQFPWEILAKMAPLGFLGEPVPEKYGGAGFDYLTHAVVTEEIGRADSSVRTTLSVQVSLVALTILRWGTEEQKRHCLPLLCSGQWLGCFGLTEANAGSDAANQSTTARREGRSWVINGSKMWISNGSVAKLALIIAQTDKTKGHTGLAAFLVETGTPGFKSRVMKGKMGLRSSDTAELILEDVRVPAEALLGQVGDGFKVAMTALDNGRYSVAAGCVGICQGSLDASTKYAQERIAFGRPIGQFQLVQELIAEMVVKTESARLLTYRAGHVKNQGLRSTRETSIAKYYASEAACWCADQAIQVHGGYGYSDEFPVERYYRDARVATLYEGTSQIQKLIIGEFQLGLRAFT
ncbi:MAG: acyl-CoA dehydrogenase family protein [Deinococcus sp.]|nr:acyl-CoA dehydrogenase family protein [Deinococcus sp.]